ncbi:unnamed protein product [Protopolystoma xenopodis]|uniref:ATP-sulfurylase PUA-like domain-containing protein n=1 Tax=Protopolystoma xenopodis TaxID=117903 RepID=A0A448XGI3_9PLAT|nr:unnamed protein product [Protopolystoma xenopodis]
MARLTDDAGETSGKVPRPRQDDLVSSAFTPRELFIKSTGVELAKREAGGLPKLSLTTIELQWIQVLSEGWASPLRGFMREREYLQCLFFGGLLQSEQIRECEIGFPE